MKMKITKRHAAEVIKIVDAGLVHGLGKPEPGKMCVEAAVCYALGLPHGDNPKCVSRVLRSLKISLNDRNWSSDKARARGLRKLAVLQLGTKDTLDEKAFLAAVVEMTIKKIVPRALRSAIKISKNAKHKKAMEAAAVECAEKGTKEAANAAMAAASVAANAAAYAAANAAYSDLVRKYFPKPPKGK